MRRFKMLACAAMSGGILAAGSSAEAATLYSFDWDYSYERSTETRDAPRGITLPGPYGSATLKPAALPFSPFGFTRDRTTTIESLTVNVSGTFTCYAEGDGPAACGRSPWCRPLSRASRGSAPRRNSLRWDASIVADPLGVEAVLAEAVATGAIGFAGLLDCELTAGDGDGDGGPRGRAEPLGRRRGA